MSSPTPPEDGATDDAAGDDIGAPVEALLDFELEVDDAFAQKVGRRIERRVLANELVTLAWTGPLAALLELLHIPFAWFAGRSRSQRPPTP
jgi:hypothetical protein